MEQTFNALFIDRRERLFLPREKGLGISGKPGLSVAFMYSSNQRHFARR